MTLNAGSTGFMLLATSLVMLMTPGLAFFYGGLVGRKNTLTIIMQSFVSLGWTAVLWVLFGFSLSFGHSTGLLSGILGGPQYLLLNNISPSMLFPGNDQIPMLLFVVYQMMFAVITPALITGAFADRVRFPAYMIFLTGWLVLVYFPFAHMIWGGGILERWGVLDFAGGIVVHVSAGFAALAAVFYIGRRKTIHKGPHNIPLMALGTALLWFGWYGFNGGSALRIDDVTVTAFINTQVAAAFASVTWLFLEIIFKKKPSLVGFMTGAIAGLATITPASGFVSVQAAMIIGIVAALVTYAAILFKNRKQWDDALDVWGVHGIGGFVGILLLGVFASTTINAHGANGLLHGNPMFFVKELVAVSVLAVYAFLVTYGLLWVIDKVTPVRASPEEEKQGLDEIMHGESAYMDY
jgi:Amt family ammonium transporter